LKATAKCPNCGHEIASSESVESFSGRNWSSDFLVIKEMTLDWTIDVESVEVVFAPQANEHFVNKKTGVAGIKQKAHLQRWRVAEVAEDDDDDRNGLTDADHARADAISDTAPSKRKKADQEWLAAYRGKVRGTQKS
jgi:hypothetical protein